MLNENYKSHFNKKIMQELFIVICLTSALHLIGNRDEVYGNTRVI